MTDSRAWLRRAQQNSRGVGAVLYLPSNWTGDPTLYETGIDNAHRDLQLWCFREHGKTFRRFDCVTVRGTRPAEWFKTQGMFETVTEIVGAAGNLFLGGRRISAADPYRLWVCYSPTTTWLGGCMGIDGWVKTNDGTNPDYPSPGRTGLQGKGLELLALKPVTYDGPEGWKVEGHADERQEWIGAMAHEIFVHGLRNMPHATDATSLSNNFWGFLGYPEVRLLERERAENLKSGFLR